MKTIPWRTIPPAFPRIRRGHWSTEGLVAVVHTGFGLAPFLSDPAGIERQWTIVNGTAPGLLPTEEGTLLHMTNAAGTYLSATNTGASTVPLLPKNGFTICFLYKPLESTPAADRCIIGFGNTGDANPYIQILHRNANGNIAFQFRDNAGTLSNISASIAMTANRIVAVGIWSDGVSNHGIRINGASYTTGSLTLGAMTAPTNCTVNALVRTSVQNIGNGSYGGPWFWDKVWPVDAIDELLDNLSQTFEPLEREADRWSDAIVPFDVDQTANIGVSGTMGLTGDIQRVILRWRFPTNIPNGTPIHVIILQGTNPNYTIWTQMNTTVSGGMVDIAALGTPGSRYLAFFHNYDDNQGSTSIFGGAAIAEIENIGA